MLLNLNPPRTLTTEERNHRLQHALDDIAILCEQFANAECPHCKMLALKEIHMIAQEAMAGEV